MWLELLAQKRYKLYKELCFFARASVVDPQCALIFEADLKNPCYKLLCLDLVVAPLMPALKHYTSSSLHRV